MSRTELQSAIDLLSEEIRRYPTPIARCDEQLTALIEERALLHSQLISFPNDRETCSPLALWVNDGGCNAA